RYQDRGCRAGKRLRVGLAVLPGLRDPRQPPAPTCLPAQTSPACAGLIFQPSFMPPPDSTLVARLAGWFKGRAAGRIEQLRHVASPQLGNRRTITVYLPPGYTHEQVYPLLVAHDGQEMGAWKLANALARHHAAGCVSPVVAAISANPARMHEYGTAGQLNGDGLGARAAQFQAFVTDTV